MMMRRFPLLPALALLVALSGTGVGEGTEQLAAGKPRVIITTDIGQDPDDTQSLIRFLTYANEFEIEGIIANADNNATYEKAELRTDIVRDIIQRYGVVLANLKVHASGWPTADYLQSVTFDGVAGNGTKVAVFDTIGPGKDTPGSNHIVRVVEDATDSRPVHVAIWGGAADLAQALFDIRHSPRSAAEKSAFYAKLRVYSIGRQDSTNQWIEEQFPQLFYILSLRPNKMHSAYRGMYHNGDGPQARQVPPGVEALNQQAWVEQNIIHNHGPFAAAYPLVNQNPRWLNHGKGVKEGDTPSWFYFLRNGLQNPAQPTWGGWGGRLAAGKSEYRFTDDVLDDVPSEVSSSDNARRKWTIARWREAYQNDFAARIDWSHQEVFSAANHRPTIELTVGLQGHRRVATGRVLELDVAPGQKLTLDAANSHDPDEGQLLDYRWWQYREAADSSFVVSLTTSGAESTVNPRVELSIPEAVTRGECHLILEVRDRGSPPLVSYQRVVLRVQS